jgi:PadR family transcriptional regulator, regulatory protein AphA
MSLPHALLGLLNYQPATGYDLKIAFKQSIHFFWDAALPHIYRTLKQMEGEGWITATMEHQEGKPSRKVYQLTEEGRKELSRWLAEPLELPEPRLPLLVKVFFGNRMEPGQFREHLKQWRSLHREKLEKMEAEVAPVIKKYSTGGGGSREAYYWGLTLDFGRRHAQMVIEWCDQALKDLEGTDRTKKKRSPREKGK